MPLIPPDPVDPVPSTSNQGSSTNQDNQASQLSSYNQELIQLQTAQQVVPSVSDKFDIIRLKGSNWGDWKWQLQNILDARGLTDVLTGNDPRGSPRETSARNILSSSLDASIISKVKHCRTAQAIWTCLRGIYENRTSYALTDLNGRMNTMKMQTLDDVENGVSEIQSIASQIEALGGKVDNFAIESAILRALPRSFSSFVTSWTFLDADKRTLENLHAHIMSTVTNLRSLEQNEKQGDRALSAHNTRGKGRYNKTKKSPEQSAGKKSLFCRYCKKTNHVIEDCIKLKKKKESEGKSSNPDRPKPEASPKDDEGPSNARVAYGHVATCGEVNKCLKVSSGSKHVTATWIADSGASFHMTPHLEWLADYHELAEKISVKLGDNRIVKAYGRGFIETDFGVLDPVFYLPDISENLFSTSSCARNHKIFSLTTDKHIVFLKEDKEIFKGYINDNNIYEINFTMKLAKFVTMLSASLDDWHDRLVHVSPQVIKHMSKNNIVDRLFISDSPQPRCEPCAEGKSKRASHSTKTTPRSATPGQVLHFDTVGPMPEKSLSGKLYYVLCKDAASAFRQVFFVSSKSEIADNVKKLISRAQVETGNSCLKVISDNGTEYLNSNLKVYLDHRGIIHHTSVAYTPEQNGLIERDIRTVAEAARTIRLKSGLPKQFWAEAINTSVYTLNRVINSRNKEKTPFELWHNRKPSLNNLHRFGELAIVHVQRNNRDKLDAKGERMIFGAL